MSQPFTTQSLTTLVNYPFKDPRWKEKCAIGVAISFVSLFTLFIPSVLVVGYGYQIMRRIIVDGEEPYLPEWDDWGKFFTDGMRLAGAGLIIYLPIILIFSAAGAFAILPLFLSGFPAQTGTVTGPVVLVSTMLQLILFGVGILVSIPLGILWPAMIGQVVATHSFSAIFQIRAWWRIFRANVGGFLMVYVLVIGFSLALYMVFQLLALTIIFCCLAPVVLAGLNFFTIVITYPLYAKAYRDGAQTLSAV